MMGIVSVFRTKQQEAAKAKRREANRKFLAQVASVQPEDLVDSRRFIDVFGQKAFITARQMMVQAVGDGRMKYLKIDHNINTFTIGDFLDQMG